MWFGISVRLSSGSFVVGEVPAPVESHGRRCGVPSCPLRAHSLLPFGAFAVAVAVVAWIWRFFVAYREGRIVFV